MDVAAAASRTRRAATHARAQPTHTPPVVRGRSVPHHVHHHPDRPPTESTGQYRTNRTRTEGPARGETCAVGGRRVHERPSPQAGLEPFPRCGTCVFVLP